MNENDQQSSVGGSATGPSDKTSSAHSRSGGDKQTVTTVASDASDAVVTEAKALGRPAQRLAQEEAEIVKDVTASHMDTFADALRLASENLSKNQSGPAAELVANAASGLESLSRSIHGKSTGEMVDTVRRFGRENPTGFLAASILAGLALGRFAAAAGPKVTDNTGSAAQAGSSGPVGDGPIPGAGGNNQ